MKEALAMTSQTHMQEYPNGDKFWSKNLKLHRDDGPAVELADGTKKWYRNGQLHRDDGPAVIDASGAEFFYRDGKLQTNQRDHVVSYEEELRASAQAILDESDTEIPTTDTFQMN